MQKCRQVSEQVLGENCVEESPRYLDIVGGFQRKLAQIVLVEEAIEKLRAKDNGGRNGDLNAFELAPHLVVVDQRVQESQTARLAAQ